MKSVEDVSEEGIRVEKWKKRGKKVPTRPSETVMVEDDSDDDSDEEETNAYKDLKKHELRQECIKRNIHASGSNKILVKRLGTGNSLRLTCVLNH